MFGGRQKLKMHKQCLGLMFAFFGGLSKIKMCVQDSQHFDYKVTNLKYIQFFTKGYYNIIYSTRQWRSVGNSKE